MKNNLTYDPKDKESIIDYARNLIGNSLRTACTVSPDDCSKFSGKGTFGQTLEKYYFGYEPNSDAGPDFPDVGIELKSTPLKKLRNSEFRAKERLVLNIIDYMKIVNQKFEDSSFWRKNAHLLLVFYLHEKDTNFMDYVIHIVDEWTFSKKDIEVIKKDWEVIQAKVKSGKAHELSEGDTYYLGACPKGKDSSTLRQQPHSDEMAMQRAFSFKASYVNHIIASLAIGMDVRYGKIIPYLSIEQEDKNSISIHKKISLLTTQKEDVSIEDAIVEKYAKYYGKSIDEIQKALNIDLKKNSKQYFALLSNQIQQYEEIDKAGIIIKTIVLQNGDRPPKESMSFQAFKYEDIATEEWENSQFKELLESKFLFVFFQQKNNTLVLRKVKIWNMPYSDRMEARKVWEKTKIVILNGDIIQSISEDGRRKTNFPNMKFNTIAHVRPHAVNVNDTYPLPIMDRLTLSKEYTKHAFWLNNSYIYSIFKEK